MLYSFRNLTHSIGMVIHHMNFVKPSLYILSSLKSFWLSFESESVNLYSFTNKLDSLTLVHFGHLAKQGLKDNVVCQESCA